MFRNLTLAQQMFFFVLAVFLILLVFRILVKLKLAPVLLYAACANLIFPEWVAEQKALQEASSAWEQEQERARQLLKSAEQDASNTANTVQATITALEKEKAALKEEVARKQEVVDELQAVQMMRMQEVSVRVRHHA